jgi:protein TonB
MIATPLPFLEGARPAARTLALAALLSIAGHGALLAAAHWLWGAATPPRPPVMVAIAVIPAASLTPAPRADNVEPATKPVAKRAPAINTAKKKIRRPHQTQAQPGKSSLADSKPKKPRPALPAPDWLTEPPLPPKPPAFHSANAEPDAASPISMEVQKTVIAPATAPKSAPVPPQSSKSLAAHEQVPGLPPTPSVEVASRPAPLSGGANPAPRYPWISRQRGEQGRVIVTVTVSAKGHPREVGIKRSSGYRRLDEAAVAAVRKWRFVPAKRRGRAVAGRARVPVTFRLTD